MALPPPAYRLHNTRGDASLRGFLAENTCVLYTFVIICISCCFSSTTVQIPPPNRQISKRSSIPNTITPVQNVLQTHNHNYINNNSTYTNTKHNWQTQIHRRLRCSGTNVLLLTSEFGSLICGDRHNSWKSFVSYYANNTTTLVICRGSISISQHHGRTPNSTVCYRGRQPNCLPTWPKVNSQLLLLTISTLCYLQEPT